MKLPYFLLLSSLTGLSALHAQDRNTCCEQPPLRPAFTGGNAPGLDPATTASTADIAVVVAATKVTNEGGQWTLTTAIANDNGNNCTPADNSRAIIQLPPDCMVLRVSATKADGSAATWTQCGATIEVQVGQLCPAKGAIGDPAKINVVLEYSKYKSAGCLPAFGVFAFSGMPDHVPGNNNWWWRDTCGAGTTNYTLTGRPNWSPKEQPLPSRGR